MRGKMRRRFGVSAVAYLAVASVSALPGDAFAASASDSVTAQPAPGGTVKTDADQVTNRPAETPDDRGCGSKPDRQRTPPPEPVSARELIEGAEVEPGTPAGSPQWACAEKTITLDPIWAGKPLKATWVVRNTGQGDLTVKVRGG